MENMKFEYYEVNKLPIVVIDNYYDASACSLIWNELCFLNSRNDKLDLPEDSGTAYDANKVALKKNKSIFLDKIYGNNRIISDILCENRRIFSQNLIEKMTDYHSFYKFIKNTIYDSTLISYYENTDHYKPHHDQAVITLITWFYKQPKQFSGGEIIVENEVKIDCKYNRTIIFPSILVHEVPPVIVPENFVGQNYGRYSITQFLKA